MILMRPRDRTRWHDRRNGVLVDHLRDGVLEQHDVLVEGFDLSLELETDEDLEQVKNLGDKSIEEIKAVLGTMGLSLGMRIDPNLLGTLGRGGVK